MDTFIEAIAVLLIPQVVSGLLGGLIGSLISVKVELYGWRLSILFGICSIISAGALAEYLTYSNGLKFILLHCVLGMLVGVVGNAALDALNLAAPEHMRKIVNGTGDGILYKIKKYFGTKDEEI